MKKIFLSILTLGFLAIAIISCQSNTKKTEVKDTTNTEERDSLIAALSDTTKGPVKLNVPNVSPLPPTPAEIERAKVSAPNFSDADVNEGIKEFDVIKAEYETALKNKDNGAIKIAVDKFNAWVSKAATWGSKFPEKEKQAYINYYQKLALQWDILTRQAAKK
jgi:2-succinyl-5-enolpyruvyl-6-hydroxy-3-cyclohexene-1-carboxylate synthase